MARMTIEVGERLSGVVTNVVPFGAFVDLGHHQSGLIHISEISNEYVRDIHRFIKKGQKVKVTVLDVQKNGRIALSLREGEDEKPSKEVEANENFVTEDFDQVMSHFLSQSTEELRRIQLNLKSKDIEE